MADLSAVLLFCSLYSGVVVAALWMTISRKASRTGAPGGSILSRYGDDMRNESQTGEWTLNAALMDREQRAQS